MSGSPPALNPSPLTLAVLSSAASALVDVARSSFTECGFEPLIRGIVVACEAVGVQVDRVQLPTSPSSGFRHPVYAGILSTWQRGEGVEVIVRYHESAQGEVLPDLRTLLTGSPYFPLIFEEADTVRQPLHPGPLPLKIYEQLRDQGYVDYLAVALLLPDGRRQPLSLAARTPLPADAEERMLALRPTLALAVYGVYAASAARQLALTYIGQHSGLSVLSGDITRGQTRQREAGILFTDLRGFTAMTRQIGAGPTVAVLNAVFDEVGEVVEAAGGEILKFIGDAMLVIFPITETRSREDVARSLVAVAREGLARVAAMPADQRVLQIGFGGHIGRVQLGNIGTARRLDFTVIGPAVNLASRLEGLCTRLSEPAVFSEEIAAVVPLRPLGSQSVKGVDEPVAVFGL